MQSARTEVPPDVSRTTAEASRTIEQASFGPYAKRPQSVSVPKFPKLQELTVWMNRLARNLWSASQYGDRKEVGWLLEVYEKSFDELGDSGEDRFAHIDGLLAQSAEKILPPDLWRVYQEKCAEAMKRKDCVLGRQIIWLIVNYFKTANHMSTVYSYSNLEELAWFGDAHVEEFIFQYLRIIDNLTSPLEMEARRDILFKKMEQSKIFEFDCAHYRRQKAKSNSTVQAEDFTEEYLLGCLVRVIDERREEKQVRARKEGLRRGAGGAKGGGIDDNSPAAGAVGGKGAGGGGDPGGKKTKKEKNANKKKKEKEALAEQEREAAAAATKGEGKGKDPHWRTKGKICWNHQNSFRGGNACKHGEKCPFKHGPKCSDDEFKKMRRPSRSPAPKPKTGEPLPYKVVDGRKIPNHCFKFLKDGKCDNKEKYDKDCIYPHYTKAQLEAETKKIN